MNNNSFSFNGSESIRFSFLTYSRSRLKTIFQAFVETKERSHSAEEANLGLCELTSPQSSLGHPVDSVAKVAAGLYYAQIVVHLKPSRFVQRISEKREIAVIRSKRQALLF